MTEAAVAQVETLENQAPYPDHFAPREEVLDFLGVETCRVVFRRCKHVIAQKDGTFRLTPEYRRTRKILSELLLLDYGEEEPRFRVVSRQRGYVPFFSPDGEKIVYTLTFSPTEIFVERIDNSRDPVVVGFGANPTWWADPENGDEYVIYRTKNGKFIWPHPGVTLRQKVDRETGRPIGDPEQILDKGFGAGLTPDGRYLVTGFHSLDIVDLHTGRQWMVLQGAQVCNVTLAPDNSHRIMSLRYNHHYFGVTSLNGTVDTTFRIPEPLYDWHTPKWTNHPDFAVVVGSTPRVLYDIYAYRLSDGAMKKIVWGDSYIHPHMWLCKGGRT